MENEVSGVYFSIDRINIFLSKQAAGHHHPLTQEIEMSLNLLQLLQQSQAHMNMLRLDTNATKTDTLDDIEQRLVKLIHCVISTPTVLNFNLPISTYDQNDVFLRQEAFVCSEV